MADRTASVPSMKAVRVPRDHYDVAILGGGLAGLALANQLMLARPETKVLVTDKRAEPPPESAFKVGESSVEVGAYYYRNKAGMADHLDTQHIRKLGLRFFLPAGDNSDITRRVEFSTPPTRSDSRVRQRVFTHQIDRGVFENALFDRALAARSRCVQGLARGGRGAEAGVRARRDAQPRGRAQDARRRAGSSTRPGASTCCGASSGCRRRPAITSTPRGSA